MEKLIIWGLILCGAVLTTGQEKVNNTSPFFGCRAKSSNVHHSSCDCILIDETSETYQLSCPVNTTPSDNDDSKLFTAAYIHKGGINASLKIDCPDKVGHPLNSSLYDYLDDISTSNIYSLELNTCPLQDSNISILIRKWTNTSSVLQLKIRHSQPSLFSLDPSSFHQLNNLNQLYLKDNNMSVLNKGLFDDLYNLEHLWMDDNRLEIIPGLIFKNLNRLKILQLGSNHINQLEVDTFAGLSSLRNLNLMSNELETLANHIFKPLENLITLELMNNRISTFDEDVFQFNSNLEKLSIRNNLLVSLPPNIFSSNSKLTYLGLNDNRNLTVIPTNVFALLSSLQILELGGCNLSSLNPGWFSNLHNLITLDLSRNSLTSIEPNVFVSLGKLTELKLQQNQLVLLKSDVFRGMGNLKDLYLQRNGLISIELTVLEPLKQLEKIDLAKNNLTFNGGPMQDIFGLPQSPLHKNLRLRHIDLSYNLIDTIFPDWGNMNDLLELNLRRNKFSDLSFEDLSNLGLNVEVNLQDNEIRRIDLEIAAIIDTEKTGKDKKRTLEIDGNPLSCDCFTYTFVKYMNKTLADNVAYSWNINAPKLKCQEPKFLEKKRPITVDPSQFICQFKDPSSPCQYTQRPSEKALLLDCRNTSATDIPSTRPKSPIPSPGYKIHLKLDGSQVGLLKTRNYTEVTVLDLSLNDLNSTVFDLPWWKNLPNLSRLNLTHNKIESIPTEVLDTWNGTRDLTLLLSNNTWKCECSNRAILDIPFSLRIRIEDYHQMICKENGVKFEELHLECANSILRTGYVAMPLCALIILALFIVFYRYMKVIKVWMYNKGICLQWISKDEDEEDDERIYDAFISFSHVDEDFVIQELVPELENPSSGERGFQLCLHYRDWLAGEWIPDQISRSVVSSRRTIVILSENFLDSLWGQLEFRTAYQQVLKDKCMRLIIIVKGELPPKEKMDDELKTYLSLNTYLKWGDPWFWHRLRYALPHKKSPVAVGSRLSQAILHHSNGTNIGKEQTNGTKLKQLPPLPLMDRTNHTAPIVLPPGIEMSLTPTSSASSTAPIFPTSPK